MNADKMETSITSETISQQTVCGEIEKPSNGQKFPEVVEKVPWTGNKDKECSNERITKIEQTGKDLNNARKVYFNLIKTQKMARTKRTVREGRRLLGEEPKRRERRWLRLPPSPLVWEYRRKYDISVLA